MKKLILFCLLIFSGAPAFSAGLINDTEIENFLVDLMRPLAVAADVPHGVLKVRIVNDDSFNAFVAGGEEVFIYTGLITRIDSPLALQAVVAHELAHTLGGHMIQMSARLEAEMKRSLIIQALGVGMMVAGGNPQLGAGVLAGSGGIAKSSMMSFSRDEERMADEMGISLLIKAGLDPNGLLKVLEKMQDITEPVESKINPNMVNHPLTSERIQNVRERIKQSKVKIKHDAANDTENMAKYSLIRAKLIGYLDTPNRVISMYPYSDKSDAAFYARTISDMKSGDLKSAKKGVSVLVSRSPKNPYFYELLGDIEYQLGDYDNSIDAYETSLKLSKNAPQIQTALALVLSERKKTGDNERAIELCKRAILTDPAPLTYWVLARAYNDGRSDWAMAEYYNMLGVSKNAKKYARRAQGALPKNSPEYIKSGDILNSK